MSTSYYFGYAKGYRVLHDKLKNKIPCPLFAQGFKFDPNTGENLKEFVIDSKLRDEFEKLLGDDYKAYVSVGNDNQRSYIFGNICKSDLYYGEEFIESSKCVTHKKLNELLEFLKTNNIAFSEFEGAFGYVC